MNRKGFAISIVMYAMVFLLIALFYILLSVVKARYTVNNNLRESIVQELNESNHGSYHGNNEIHISTTHQYDGRYIVYDCWWTDGTRWCC